MSNRKLVFAAVALIGCVVASVAWFLLGEAAAQEAQREERRPPMTAPRVYERPTSAGSGFGIDGAVARRSPGEVGAAEMGAGEVGAGQVAKGQIAKGQIAAKGSVPADCPCREPRRG